MIKKTFIDANSLLLDSFALARQIYKSNFSPTLLIGLWRGGTPPGIAIHEFLTFKGLTLDHTVIKVQSYHGIENKGEIRIEVLDHVFSLIQPDARILLVDDIFDTGRSLEAVIRAIQEKAKEKNPKIKIATVYYKPSHNQTCLSPDFYIKSVDQWVVFPHELKDLTQEEVRQKGEEIYGLIFE